MPTPATNSPRPFRSRLAAPLAALAVLLTPAAFGAPSASPASSALPAPPVVSAAAPADARANDPTIAKALAARLAAEYEAQRLIGVSVAIVEGERVTRTLHQGYEYLDKDEVAGDATMYRWASVSKPLTAVVAMQLFEQGKLDLDSDVRALVPEFPDKGRKITPRQLLCHQGGVVHYTNGPVVRTPRPELDGRYTDVIDALDTFKNSPLVADPGEKYAYTTHGYILLGAAVQRAGGEPYPAQVAARIAAPLGMTTLRPDYQWEEIPNRASGYRRFRQGRLPSTNTDVSWKLPGGGYISNVRDMGLLAVGLMSDRLLKPETRELMFTRQRTADGAATDYGLGFNIGRLGGHRLVRHGGSQEKTRTELAMLPDRKLAVAIMCNTEGVNLVPLARDLLSIMLGEPIAGAESAERAQEPAEAQR